MTVKELREKLENDFHDDDQIKFEVCLDSEHRTSYYGNESVFISDMGSTGPDQGDCVIHISGDVDEEG